MKREADGVFLVCVFKTSTLKTRRSSPAQSSLGADEQQHVAFLPPANAEAVRAQLEANHPWSEGRSPTPAERDRLAGVAMVVARGGGTATDVTLKALGVQVSWFDGFDPLPELLASIRPAPVS